MGMGMGMGMGMVMMMVFTLSNEIYVVEDNERSVAEEFGERLIPHQLVKFTGRCNYDMGFTDGFR